MARVLVACFLVAHGLVHLAIYGAPIDPAKPGPFDPRRSWATPYGVTAAAMRSGSVALASAVAAAYGTAGLMVALGAGSRAAVAGLAALLGLVLKGLWFHPWLSLGIALDLAVVVSAVLDWPASL